MFKLKISLLFLVISMVASKAVANEWVTVAISSTPSNLNPFYSADANSQNINRLVYRSLIDFNRKMQPVCDLCLSFSQTIEQNGEQRVSFKLRPNQLFHDGSKITTRDIANLVEQFKSQKIGSIFKASFERIKSVKPINEYEIEIVFDKFDYDNLPNFSLLRVFKLQGEFQKDFNFKNFIGSGDYWFHAVSDQNIKLISRKESNNFEFKVVKDETTTALKIVNQEIDVSIANMSPRKFDWLKKNAKGSVDIISSKGSNYVYLNLNHENKYLKRLEFRKAISMMVPVGKIIKYRFKGYAEIANSIFSPAFKEFYQQNGSTQYNPEEAKRLLNSLGAKKREDGLYYLNNEPLSFDLLISSNKNTYEVAKILQDEFKLGGITINVVSTEWGTFMRRYKGGQFDFVLAQWVGFTGPGILNYIFHSKNIPPNGGNRGRYKNPRFEEFYEKSLFTEDSVKRNEFVKKAVNEAFNDVAYVSLWHPNVTWVVRNCIKNIKPFSNGSFLALKEASKQCQN